MSPIDKTKAEEIAEYISEIREVHGEIGNATSAFHSCMTEAVICSPSIRVGEHRIRFINLFEALLGVGVIVDIRVVFPGQTTKS